MGKMKKIDRRAGTPEACENVRHRIECARHFLIRAVMIFEAERDNVKLSAQNRRKCAQLADDLRRVLNHVYLYGETPTYSIPE
jgi:hypothetical protein